jgi:hypothetical protein
VERTATSPSLHPRPASPKSTAQDLEAPTLKSTIHNGSSGQPFGQLVAPVAERWMGSCRETGLRSAMGGASGGDFVTGNRYGEPWTGPLRTTTNHGKSGYAQLGGCCWRGEGVEVEAYTAGRGALIAEAEACRHSQALGQYHCSNFGIGVEVISYYRLPGSTFVEALKLLRPLSESVCSEYV